MNKNYITFGQVTVGKVTVGQVVALFLFAALFSMSMLAISYWMDDRRRKKTLKKMSSNNLDMSKPLRPHDILDMEEVKNRTEIRRLIRLINEQLIKNKEVFKNQDSIEFSMKILRKNFSDRRKIEDFLVSFFEKNKWKIRCIYDAEKDLTQFIFSLPNEMMTTAIG